MLNLGVINAHIQWDQTYPECSLHHCRASICLSETPKFLPVSSSGHSHPPSWSMDPSLPRLSLASTSGPHVSPPFWGCASVYQPQNLMSPHFGKRPRVAPASQMASWVNLPMNFILLEFKNHIHIWFFLYFQGLWHSARLPFVNNRYLWTWR